MSTKLFIVQTSGMSDFGAHFMLIAETGEPLFSHFCSHKGYAKGDLIGERESRLAELHLRYGAWEVHHINEQSEITEDELIARNREFVELHESRNPTETPCKSS